MPRSTAPDQLAARLEQLFPQALVGGLVHSDPTQSVSGSSPHASRGADLVIACQAQHWPSLAASLAGEENYLFLSDLCGVDWRHRSPRFEVVYHLTNLDGPYRLRVRCAVDSDPPVMPTVTHIWPTANWHEREVFDMFGIHFEGHPDLRRILMPDQWEGHPLRKDYAMGKVPIEFRDLNPYPVEGRRGFHQEEF